MSGIKICVPLAGKEQLKEKLRGPSREGNWESIREERLLNASRERTEMSLDPDGTKRAEGVVAPITADEL